METIVKLSQYKLISMFILVLICSATIYSQNSYVVYASDSGTPLSAVNRMATDGTGSTAIWTAPNNSTYIEALAVDASLSKVYFYVDTVSFDKGKIYRCNLDGGSLEMFLDVAADGGVARMAAANGYLYYAPYNGTSLKRIKSDGTNDTTIYSGSTRIADVTLDITNNYLFFVESGNGGSIAYRLYRSNLNGGNLTSLYSTSNNYLIGGISAGNGYVFFKTGNVHNEQRIDNDGNNLTTVYTVSGGAVNNGAYDEYNKNLYFSYNNVIYKCGADGTGATVLKDVGLSLGFGGNMDVAPNISSLPVELNSLTAAQNGNKVELNWTTATEVNNYGFEVERWQADLSAGAENSNQNSVNQFEKIGFVAGAGNSNSPKEYSFVDNSKLNGTYQYRLKQIDIDGNYEYSEIVSVEISSGGSLPQEFALHQNYPNPFNPATVIRYSIPSVAAPSLVEGQFVTLKVYDILGNEVATIVNENQPAGNYEVTFNAAGLASGVYFYKLQTSSGFVSTKKLMLMK